MFKFSQKYLGILLSLLFTVQATLPAGWSEFPTLTPLELEKPSLESVELIGGIKAYQDKPLGDRTPLVLVHGIGGTATRYYHWENLLKAMDRNKEFTSRYKVYFYYYDSTRSVPQISSDLKGELRRFIKAYQKRVKILAYSEGGLLVRNAMEDPYINDHTESVLTIATPFHGSPLANPEWLKQQVEAEDGFSIVRLTQKFAYDITGRRYPAFREDFRWDNFDEAIPLEQYVKNNGPVVLRDYALEEKKNFITYGSYFGIDADPHGTLPKALNVEVPLPKEEMQFGNLFKKNFLFSVIRNNIGKLPVMAFKKPAAPEVPVAEDLEEVTLEGEAFAVSMVHAGSAVPVPAVAGIVSAKRDLSAEIPAINNRLPASMMTFNDGISPISSTLWLGRFTPNFSNIKDPAERVWAALKSLKGSKNARLFAGLDHRNWMDGTPRTDEEKLVDLLNPDEPPKTVFEWIIHDLMG